ncbi:hypothetical protein [Lysobacter capsici]|uniref:hypothetical protein n=1 Tax=Lysobacter capsici TaxID=435897 RepID=UPI00190FC5AD|nr:hypothetical protein [Lysobacter capsici]
MNQVPASAEQTRACATRDILSRWRTAHIHVRRPSGVLLFSRAPSFAALDELRGFRLKPNFNSNSNPSGKRQAASGKRQAASGKRQAASGKRQAASGKRQAASGKRQAASGKRQAASGKRK